jgi:hypothetical protein
MRPLSWSWENLTRSKEEEVWQPSGLAHWLQHHPDSSSAQCPAEAEEGGYNLCGDLYNLVGDAEEDASSSIRSSSEDNSNRSSCNGNADIPFPAAWVAPKGSDSAAKRQRKSSDTIYESPKAVVRVAVEMNVDVEAANENVEEVGKQLSSLARDSLGLNVSRISTNMKMNQVKLAASKRRDNASVAKGSVPAFMF